ncbi:hypothetical protein DFH29DRAFT_998996 [Suillus ampliporus]|nr:hypothetical protein DFH29DRAFT_998996 [Suillus ampliporus]
MQQEQIRLTAGQISNTVAFLQNLPDAPEEVNYLCSALTRTLSHTAGIQILLSHQQEEGIHSPSFLPTPHPTPPPMSSDSYLEMPSVHTGLSEHQASALPHSLESGNQQAAGNQLCELAHNVPNPNCPRGGRRLNRKNQDSWKRRPNPQIKGSTSMEAIVGELGAAHPESESYNPVMWAQDIENSLSDQGSFQEGSFEELITHCMSLSQQDVAVNFLRMLGLIQLVTKCQSLRVGTAIMVDEIYKTRIAPLKLNHLSARTFKDWIQSGSKFAALAAGGTIYILVVVAGLELRTTVGSMVGDSPWQLGNALRQPDPNTAIGRTILERIIPTVNILRRHLPLSMASMFSPSLLAHHKLPRDINCTNLEASDRFFNSIIFK